MRAFDTRRERKRNVFPPQRWMPCPCGTRKKRRCARQDFRRELVRVRFTFLFVWSCRSKAVWESVQQLSHQHLQYLQLTNPQFILVCRFFAQREMALFGGKGTRRNATIMASGYCDLDILWKRDFGAVLQEFPITRDMIQGRIHKKAKRISVINKKIMRKKSIQQVSVVNSPPDGKLTNNYYRKIAQHLKNF